MKRLFLSAISILLLSGLATTTAEAMHQEHGSPRPHTGPTAYNDGRHAPVDHTTTAVGSPRSNTGPTIYNDGR